MTRSLVATPAGDVSLSLEGPDRPQQLVVLGHGAGAPMDSDFMSFFAGALVTEKRAVARFNFPYMEAGRRSPGPQQTSEAAFEAVTRHLAGELSPRSLILGGKSYGGRIASHVVAQGLSAHGLVFLGYPLHPPGKPERIRDAHLAQVTCPMLFVEGTRDPFCPLATLNDVRARLSAETAVVVVDGGDHSFKVPKNSGRSTREAWEQTAADIERWLDDHFGGGAGGAEVG